MHYGGVSSQRRPLLTCEITCVCVCCLPEAVLSDSLQFHLKVTICLNKTTCALTVCSSSLLFLTVSLSVCLHWGYKDGFQHDDEMIPQFLLFSLYFYLCVPSNMSEETWPSVSVVSTIAV